VTALIFSALLGTTDNFTAASFYRLAENGLLFATPMLLTGRPGMSMGLHTTWNFMGLTTEPARRGQRRVI
jgi:hypothetical protein